MLKTLFSKDERLLLRHNRRFVLRDDDSNVISSDDQGTLDQISTLPVRRRHSLFHSKNPYFSELMRETEHKQIPRPKEKLDRRPPEDLQLRDMSQSSYEQDLDLTQS
jgi:hypothetical protein